MRVEVESSKNTRLTRHCMQCYIICLKGSSRDPWKAFKEMIYISQSSGAEIKSL